MNQLTCKINNAVVIERQTMPNLTFAVENYFLSNPDTIMPHLEDNIFFPEDYDITIYDLEALNSMCKSIYSLHGYPEDFENSNFQPKRLKGKPEQWAIGYSGKANDKWYYYKYWRMLKRHQLRTYMKHIIHRNM